MITSRFLSQWNFGKFFTIILIGLTTILNVFAQQGGLDLTFGGGTGIYQDDLPTLPLPANPVNIGRGYGANEILANGKIIVAGYAIKLSSPDNNYYGDFVVRRLNADGTVDTSFGTNGDVQTTFYRFGTAVGAQSNTSFGAMKIQPDGKIIVAGICRINGGPNPNDTALGTDLCMIRYNSNGTLDTSFGGNTITAYGGNPNFPGTTYTMEGGKVFTFTGTNFVNSATQGYGGYPVKIKIATDGRIYVFGDSRDDIAGGTSNGGGRAKGFVAIYSTSGALQNIVSLIDTTGNSTDGWGETQIYDGDLLSNGDFIAAGYHRILVSTNPSVFSQPRWKVFTGSSGGGFLDANVNAAGSARAITMLRSNKILIGGQTGGFSQFGTATLVRYNSDLTVDTTFGTKGRIVYSDSVNFGYWIASLKNQPDGKILVTDQNGDIGRLNPNGSFDRSFARYREDIADGLDRRGLLSSYRYVTPFPVYQNSDRRIAYGDVSFRPDGRLVTSGCTGGCDVTGRAVVTQLKTSFRNGGTFSDLNNDGKAEIAVYRPTDGVWHYLDSFDNTYLPFQFGLSGDKLAPADYDGDGKTDRAVYRNGTWYIYQSSNNQVRYVQFGISEDLPRPGDFNGDGFADIAVFRPSTGYWYILYSNPIQPGNIQYSIIKFGQLGDAPVIVDFDGDGKSDVAVFRASEGNWYYVRSSDGQIGIVHFGQTGDISVAGDYDADGKTDFAIYRNGQWWIQRSSDNSVTVNQFGQNGDKAVPGDYDNDGKNDLAIYRGGQWWILYSASGAVSVTQFGLADDLPIQTAYTQ